VVAGLKSQNKIVVERTLLCQKINTTFGVLVKTNNHNREDMDELLYEKEVSRPLNLSGVWGSGGWSLWWVGGYKF